MSRQYGITRKIPGELQLCRQTELQKIRDLPKAGTTHTSASFLRANLSVNRHRIKIRVRETQDGQGCLQQKSHAKRAMSGGFGRGSEEIPLNDTISEYQYRDCPDQCQNSA
jgi:hypothetical protein